MSDQLTSDYPGLELSEARPNPGLIRLMCGTLLKLQLMEGNTPVSARYNLVLAHTVLHVMLIMLVGILRSLYQRYQFEVQEHSWKPFSQDKWPFLIYVRVYTYNRSIST